MERRRFPLPNSHWPLEKFLRALASAHPTPGGGSAAALAGAVGCALGQKVIQILLERSQPRSRQNVLERGRKILARNSKRLKQLMKKDAQVYSQWLNPSHGQQSLARAHEKVIRMPLQMCQAILEGLKTIQQVEPFAGSFLASDLHAARGLLQAAYTGARAMVKVNCLSGTLSPSVRGRVQDLVGRMDRTIKGLRNHV